MILVVLKLYNYIFFCCNFKLTFECAGNHMYVISGCSCYISMEVLCGGVCILKHAIACQASSGGPGQNNQFFRSRCFLPRERRSERASKRERERVDEIDTQRHTEYEPTPHTKPKNSLRLLVMTLVGELGDRWTFSTAMSKTPP